MGSKRIANEQIVVKDMRAHLQVVASQHVRLECVTLQYTNVARIAHQLNLHVAERLVNPRLVKDLRHTLWRVLKESNHMTLEDLTCIVRPLLARHLDLADDAIQPHICERHLL